MEEGSTLAWRRTKRVQSGRVEPALQNQHLSLLEQLHGVTETFPQLHPKRHIGSLSLPWRNCPLSITINNTFTSPASEPDPPLTAALQLIWGRAGCCLPNTDVFLSFVLSLCLFCFLLCSYDSLALLRVILEGGGIRECVCEQSAVTGHLLIPLGK
ncbi:hypothetical protein MATL_G00014500 [Megalops atlanticus]|uniref:Uncharacterized protein n=1 Tax=Megalops atlanticus TaxID=7932 RepID=A0A9D3QGT2_MEGAT|nr:hypothetical protein MATL_G00014500 [Megalops atlanticus]